MAYCAWLSEVRGEVMRLPTEAEWEAARGSSHRKGTRSETTRIYPWGNDEPDANCCNFEMNIGSTTSVGIYLAERQPLRLSGHGRQRIGVDK